MYPALGIGGDPDDALVANAKHLQGSEHSGMGVITDQDLNWRRT